MPAIVVVAVAVTCNTQGTPRNGAHLRGDESLPAHFELVTARECHVDGWAAGASEHGVDVVAEGVEPKARS